jgi:hypothetical protein
MNTNRTSILLLLLQAGGALGGLLTLGWLMREGGGTGWTLLGTATLFGTMVLGLHLRLHFRVNRRALGDWIDSTLCYLATRTRALAHYHQSGRLGYNAEVNDPMRPVEHGVLEEAR